MPSSGDSQGLQLTLINSGIGPAIIDKVEIKVDGKAMPGVMAEPIDNALKILLPANQFKYRYTRSFFMGYVLSAKEEKTMVQIHFDPTKFPVAAIFDSLTKRTDLYIEYSSIYGDKFVLDSQENKKRHLA